MRSDSAYKRIRREFLLKNNCCQAHLPGCQLYANQVHHMRGRTGKLLLDISEWLSVCAFCHHEIEMRPEMARALNFSKSRLNGKDIDNSIS